MIEHLAYLNDTFPGAANQTRCFAHILNLVAKSVLRQFETPKAKGMKAMEDAAKELAAVTDEIDNDDDEGPEDGDDVDDDVVDDDDDGLPDERDELSEEELSSLEESVKPIRLILMKVSHFYSK